MAGQLRHMDTSASTPPGTRPTGAQRAERNRQIAESHLAGQTWNQIAAAHGISPRQARRCAKTHAEGLTGTELVVSPPRVGATDVSALLGLALYGHEIALRRGLSLLFVSDNDSAYVGAMR